MFIQIGNRWINTDHITSILRYDYLGEDAVDIYLGEQEADGLVQLSDPAEIKAFLTWLSEEAQVYVVI